MKKILFIFLCFPIVAMNPLAMDPNERIMNAQQEEDPGCCSQLIQFSNNILKALCIGLFGGRHRPPFTFQTWPREQERKNLFIMLYDQCFEQIEE